MSRLTAIAILVLVLFLTIGVAAALGQAVTYATDGGVEEEHGTCPIGDDEGEEAMREHHESIHGEGSWEDMDAMHEGMNHGDPEAMREHHESVHGEGTWDGTCEKDEGVSV